MHNRFIVPFKMSAWHLWQALIHPRWSAAIVANGGVPTFENLRGMRSIQDPSASSIAASVGREIDASLNEADVVRYRVITSYSIHYTKLYECQALSTPASLSTRCDSQPAQPRSASSRRTP